MEFLKDFLYKRFNFTAIKGELDRELRRLSTINNPFNILNAPDFGESEEDEFNREPSRAEQVTKRGPSVASKKCKFIFPP